MKYSLLYCLFSFFFMLNTAHAFHSDWDEDDHQGTSPETPVETEDNYAHHDPCVGVSPGHSASPSFETGSPVIIKDGGLIWTELDVVVKGSFPLYLSRTFSSSESTFGIFGKGWTSNCERSLTKTIDYDAVKRGASNADRFILKLANGKSYPFGNDSSSTMRPRGIFASLVETGDTVTLTWAGGKVDTFVEGRLTREQDGYGNFIQYTYNGNNQLERMETNDGRWLQFHYVFSLPLVWKVEDSTGREWVYGYDLLGNLKSVTSPSGTRNYDYLPPGSFEGVGMISGLFAFLTEVKDETGVVELEVDYITDTIFGLGRVQSYSEGLTSYTYEYTWGQVDLFTTRIVRATKTGDGNEWVYNLDEDGQVHEEISPEGTVTYDLNNDFQSETTVFNTGYTLERSHDSNGRILSVDDGRSVVTYEYDTPHLNPNRIILPNELGVYDFTLNDQGDIKTYEDLDNNQYTINYYPNGTIREVVLPGEEVSWKYTYNDHGLVETVESPEGKVETFLRNSRGFVTTYRNGLLDENGIPIEWTYTYDALGRTKTVTTPEQILSTYDYDDAGRLEVVTNDASETYVLNYDDYGRLDDVTTFWNGYTDYQYYPGTYRLSKVVHPNLIESEYFYNDKNYLRQKAYPDQTIDYIYDEFGRLKTIENEQGIVVYDYNPWNQITSERVDGRLIGFDYDDLGRLEIETRFSESMLHSYDTNGLLESVTTPAGLMEFKYDTWSRLRDVLRPNDVDTSLEYYDDGKLRQIEHTGVGTLDYLLDDARRITQITGFGNTKTYSYDDDNRLLTAEYSNALQDGTVLESFEYNNLGDRRSNGEAYDTGSQLREDASYSYLYDANGNRSRRTNKSTGDYEVYGYNGLNQLTSYESFENGNDTPLKAFSYTYGPEGRRWSKTNGSDTTTYYWSGNSLIGTSENGELTKHFSSLLERDGSFYYILDDHLGSSKAIIDNSGGTVWNSEFKAYGRSVGNDDSFNWKHRLPGQVEDSESGLHYNYFRDYDPDAGRYLQSDPIGLNGGLNSYVYVQGNVVNQIDTLGLAADKIGIGTAILLGVKCAKNDACRKKFLEICQKLSSGKKSPPLITTKADQLAKNKAAGDAFEKTVKERLQKSQTDVVEQVTIKTKSGTKTRVDLVGRDANGNIACTECKASSTAPLTKNQSAAFPELEKTGGVVVGKGKPGFPGGSQIPPTKVDIVRP